MIKNDKNMNRGSTLSKKILAVFSMAGGKIVKCPAIVLYPKPSQDSRQPFQEPLIY
jgi:hypothetical protein